LQISSQIKALTRGSQDPETKKQVQELESHRKKLTNLVLSGKGKKEAIQQLEEKVNRLQATLGQQIKPFQRTALKVTPEKVINELSSIKSSLIDFQAYKARDYGDIDTKGNQLMAVVVNPEKTPSINLIPLGDLDPISRLIEQYRKTLKSPDNRKGLSAKEKEVGQQLYQALWQPLLAYINSSQKIYLSPDGVLNLLPFSTLIDPKGDYLVSNWSVNMISSARELVLPPLEDKANNSAIFSAPLYAPSQKQQYQAAISQNTGRGLTNLSFSPLPGALKEGKLLYELMQNKQIKSLHKSLSSFITDRPKSG